MTRHDHDLATRTAHQGYASAMGARIFLGHGASGTAASMAPFVDGLRRRGFDATAIDLPKRKAEDAVPAFHVVVPSEPDVRGFDDLVRLVRRGTVVPVPGLTPQVLAAALECSAAADDTTMQQERHMRDALAAIR